MQVVKMKNRKIVALLAAIAVAFAMTAPSSFVWASDASTKAVTLTKNGSDTEYSSVAEAVAQVADGEVATIALNQDYTGPGVVIGKNSIQDITIDLNNHTWNITDTVGSSGTETNGLQLLKGSTVYIKNGKLTSETARILIQNYCTLTLDNVEASGKDNLTGYIVSNNNGKTVIKGGSQITAAAGGIAFDSDEWALMTEEMYIWKTASLTETLTLQMAAR